MKNLKLLMDLVRAVKLAFRIAHEPVLAPHLVRATARSPRTAG
jgi:hypothetical protein